MTKSAAIQVELLRPAMKRLALKAAIRALWLGLLTGLVAAAAVVGVSYFAPVEYLLPIIIGAPTAGLLIGVLFALLFQRPKSKAAAKALDSLGGQERAVTMLELAGSQSEYARLQIDDAANTLPAIDVKKGIGLRQPRWVYLACAAAAVLIMASFAIPNVQRDYIAARALEKQAIHKEAVKLEAEINKQQLDEATKKELQKLADQLKKARSMSDSLKQLSKAEDQLKTLTQKQADQARSQLTAGFEGNSNTKPLADALQKKDSTAFQKSAEDLAKALKDGKLSSADKAGLQQALSAAASSQSDKQLSDALKNAAESLSSASASQASEALSQALKAADQAASGSSSSAVDADALLKSARSALNSTSSSLSNSQNGDGNGNNNGNGNGSGNGNGNGTGNGKGGGNGQGQGSGAGAGTGGGPDSENESANGYGGGKSGTQYADGGVKPQTSYEPIYDPDRLGGQDNGVTDSGTKNQNGQSDMINAGSGQGSQGNIIPYNQVLHQYQSEAAQAMDRENIPAGLKQWVEDYFSSIN